MLWIGSVCADLHPRAAHAWKHISLYQGQLAISLIITLLSLPAGLVTDTP